MLRRILLIALCYLMLNDVSQKVKQFPYHLPSGSRQSGQTVGRKTNLTSYDDLFCQNFF